MDRAIALLSGGLDSAVSLGWALDQGYEVRALTLDYHARAEVEQAATAAVARAMGVPEPTVVALPDLREVADLPTPLPPHLRSAEPSYVPHRNLVLYALAAHHAERWGARWIVGGHHDGDPAAFPDAAPAFFDDLNRLIAVGRWGDPTAAPTVVNPLEGLTKPEVVKKGLALKVPLELTWSCEDVGPRPCGVCRSCRERRDAFQTVGVPDPARP